MSRKAVVYIGEFDLRNENVQAHLVKNNGKLLKQLGYEVFFIGTNRNCSEFSEVEKLEELPAYKNHFLELPHTLTMSGLMKETVKSVVIALLETMYELYRRRTQQIWFLPIPLFTQIHIEFLM